ncbi:hypothetical protein DFH28DRAFT_923777 [Melampsora americana]|nr:hypothetical protein DFH28DRAFT_923777 [Melampsora americana]
MDYFVLKAARGQLSKYQIIDSLINGSIQLLSCLFDFISIVFLIFVNKISLTSGHVIPGLAQFGKGVTDPLQTLQSGSSTATEYTVVGSLDNEASKSLGMPTEESSTSLFGGRIYYEYFLRQLLLRTLNVLQNFSM